MKHRLFIAIDVPQSCRTEITSLQNRLDKLGLPVVWEDPPKFHLTLHFLGPTPHDQMVSLTASLHKIASASAAFDLTPYFLETLYRRHDSSIIYLGLQGDLNELKDLQKSLGHFLADFRLPAQTRFLPHITIGKLKRDDPVIIKKFLSQIEAVEISPLPEFIVDHITLYESFLTAAGSHYQKIGQYKLQYNSP